ncbi:MAG: group III truncated hemoglobin [Cellvibrionales bacterium]|nr:group III truncated hemoglobin [Cellvibrionales bacterium]
MSKAQDLDSEENIRTFIDAFYVKVLKDPVLRPIFIEGAGIDIRQHKAIIVSYWKKLLLGDKSYNRHTMNIHRAVHSEMPFTDEAFERWLGLFIETAENEYQGPFAKRAVVVASTIAKNMKTALLNKSDKHV